MKMRAPVLLRAFMAVALAVALGGCTAVRLAYNNADTLVRYMATDYVDLEPPQADEFKTRLARFHAWHRARELPAYAAFLTDAGGRLEKGIAEADVAWASAQLRAYYRRLVAQAVQEAAPVLVSLSPAQITDMEKKLADINAKFAREHHLEDQGKRVRRNARQMHKQFDDWMGSLSDAQEERIERFVREHDALSLARFEDRKRRQREGVMLIRSERDPASLASRLTELLANPDAGRTTELRAALARYEAELGRLVVEIDRGATPEQRSHAVRRVARYANDFHVLAAQKPAAATTP